jgi:hypothetical protein
MSTREVSQELVVSDVKIYDEQSAKKAVNVEYPDVYFTPAYGAAVANVESGSWELFVVRFSDGCSCFYPYVKREISSPTLRQAGQAAYDIVGPYGYAGPWSAGHVGMRHWFLFRQEFKREAHARRYVSEFIRFSPYIPLQQDTFRQLADVSCWRHLETYAVSLKNLAEYKTSASKNHRRKVKKARQNGLFSEFEVLLSTQSDLFRDFLSIYETTMYRQSASSYYHFPVEYYEALLNALRAIQGQVYVFVVYDAVKSASAASLVFQFKDTFHYHLGGSSEAGRQLGAMDLMFETIIGHGCQLGARLLHLGGGLKPHDGLSNFKRSFSNLQFEWFLGKSILNDELYKLLVREQAILQNVDSVALEQAGFFPAYRSRT